MLQPKKRKYRKEQKGRNKGIAQCGTTLSFGSAGIKATSRGRLTSKQVEAARKTLSHHSKRWGRVIIRVFPDKPISRKPAEVRMGNGKGSPEFYAFEVKPGKILYEVDGLESQAATKALSLAAAKLPLQTIIVFRQDERI